MEEIQNIIKVLINLQTPNWFFLLWSCPFIIILADNDYIFQDEAKPVQDHNNNRSLHFKLSLIAGQNYY